VIRWGSSSTETITVENICTCSKEIQRAEIRNYKNGRQRMNTVRKCPFPSERARENKKQRGKIDASMPQCPILLTRADRTFDIHVS
jgi:hypothetical protein